MTEFLLTADEALLARLAAEAEACDFSDRCVDGQPVVEIRAEAIRRFLIGLPVKSAADGFAERVTIPGPGLRLKSAIITGQLLMDDATAIDGGACPPLALEDCVISEPIHLARAHLRRLSLRGSKITHLCAPNLRLEGPLELTSITSAEAEGATTGAKSAGRCWVELQNAKVNGDVVARGAQLVAKTDEAVDGAAETTSNYALDLRGARVSDAVDLTPIGSRFRAVGGVMLANGEIGGDLRLAGAELSGRLNAQRVTIGGNAILIMSGENRFTAAGDIILLGARISGSLYMDGAELSGELIAANITVGGAALLRASGEHRFTATGDINLLGATISGSLYMDGAELSGRLVADGVTVRGAALLRAYGEHRFTAAGDINLLGANITNNLEMSGAELSGMLVAENITIGGAAFLRAFGEHRFTAAGDIRLLGATITGNLEMDGAELSGALIAQSVTIGGNALLRASGEHRFTAAGDIRLLGATITGTLDMGGAELSGSANFTNATVAGTMRLRVKTLKSDKSDIRFNLTGTSVGALEDDGGRGFPTGVRLILDGFKYGGLEPHETTDRSIWSRAQRRLARVPFAVWAGWFLLFGAVGIFGLDTHAAWGPAALVAAVLGLVVGLFGTVDLGHTRATERLAWLNKQYVRGNVKASPDLYTPEPYERLIKHFRTSGHYRDAWRVASERLTIENGVQTSRPLRFAMSLFHLFFDYGLSPVHALSTFTVCILLGWGAVTIADQGFAQRLPFEAELSRAGISAPHIKPVLELSAQPVSTLATKDGAHIGLVRVATPVSHIPCGGEIEPLLYAIDSFIPAIDLDQRNRCSVSTDDGALWWRIGRAAYTLLGWIVTSLTILTLSGILRRQAET